MIVIMSIFKQRNHPACTNYRGIILLLVLEKLQRAKDDGAGVAVNEPKGVPYWALNILLFGEWLSNAARNSAPLPQPLTNRQWLNEPYVGTVYQSSST
ncbi:unnamed protein product [Soboliphyme baturini]|uniref:Secreted protein n=1 Tax=Soboliphyme baturini TaxID=241478 RepID=A0A183IJ30_9BILA|nr:unnamed protein product [Soboliphyme baturini]